MEMGRLVLLFEKFQELALSAAKAFSRRAAAESGFGAFELKSLKFISNAAMFLSMDSNWADIFLNCSSIVKTEYGSF